MTPGRLVSLSGITVAAKIYIQSRAHWSSS